MISSSPLAELLAEFAQVIGLPALPLDENGVCTLLFGERLMVNIGSRGARDEAVLFSVLGVLPTSGEACCEALLRANDDTSEQGRDFVLALDAERRRVIAFSRAGLATLDLHAFQGWLTNFLEKSAEWRERLENWAPDPSPVPAQLLPNSLA